MKYMLICSLFLVSVYDRCSCSEPNLVFSMDNRSSDTILVYPAFGRSYTPSAYPDTLLPEKLLICGDSENSRFRNRPFDYDAPYNYVNPGINSKYFFEFEDEDNYYSLNIDTLSLFIFSKDTLRKYGYEDVRKNYRILARYDLSQSDLEMMKHNNIVRLVYPPISDMQNMKMFPAYNHFHPVNQ